MESVTYNQDWLVKLGEQFEDVEQRIEKLNDQMDKFAVDSDIGKETLLLRKMVNKLERIGEVYLIDKSGEKVGE